MSSKPKQNTVKKAESTVSLATRRTQQQRKQEAENAIVQSAIAIIAKKGLGGLTLAGAGEGAGYSRGIVGHHFGKKDELLIAIINYITRSFNDYLAKNKRIAPGLAMIEEVVERYLADIKKDSINIRAWQIILTEAVSNQEIQPALEKVNTRVVKNLAFHLLQGVRDGDIRADIDVNSQALLIVATLRGLMGHWLISGKGIKMAAVRKQLLGNIQKELCL